MDDQVPANSLLSVSYLSTPPHHVPYLAVIPEHGPEVRRHSTQHQLMAANLWTISLSHQEAVQVLPLIPHVPE